MSLLTGLHASASWLVRLARVASSRYSSNVHRFAAIPVVNQVFGQSLVYALMYSTSGGASSGVPQTRGQGLFLTIAGHEHPETIQQGKQDVCAAFDTPGLIHCGIGTAAER